MTKRAGIYIRVSSERQADKVSPQAQENDCRGYCESHGYYVVEVYRDIEKYRVGGKLVEPSGTRADRPGLRTMLCDAKSGHFDIIVAWREDRLYRSYRPMLDVLDTLDESGIELELVKETFDKRIAPVKAWAARMELDAKHDRFMMGVAGRFSMGKAGNYPAPYGYYKDENGYFRVNLEEANWIVKLFEWYAQGISIREIRMRFITGGARQRNDNLKHQWHMVILRRILTADLYWTGSQKIHWDGQIFEIPLEPIINGDLAVKVQERKAKYKYYPAGNTRESYLSAGLVLCSVCDVRCNIVSSHNGKRKDGSPKKYTFYQCSNVPNIDHINHFTRGSARKIDDQVWAKTWKVISDPDIFELELQKKIDELRAQEINAQETCEKLEQRLDDLAMERQKVITWARKGMINEDDMETQLLALSFQEISLKSELADKRMLEGNRADKLLLVAKAYREQVMVGLENINRQPQTPEQAKKQFDFKRKIVQAIVKQVYIHPDKTVTVHFCVAIPEKVCIDDPIECHW